MHSPHLHYPLIQSDCNPMYLSALCFRGTTVTFIIVASLVQFLQKLPRDSPNETATLELLSPSCINLNKKWIINTVQDLFVALSILSQFTINITIVTVSKRTLNPANFCALRASQVLSEHCSILREGIQPQIASYKWRQTLSWMGPKVLLKQKACKNPLIMQSFFHEKKSTSWLQNEKVSCKELRRALKRKEDGCYFLKPCIDDKVL